jgi:hypothetical protein
MAQENWMCPAMMLTRANRNLQKVGPLQERMVAQVNNNIRLGLTLKTIIIIMNDNHS